MENVFFCGYSIFLMKQIPPNSNVGIFGSGQLGRMLAIEARKMGYQIHTFSPASDTPTGQVADTETSAAYEDLDAVKRFAQTVDVVTFEFENVPSVCAETAAQFVPVHPRGEVLHIAQNRLREKTFLQSNGFPLADFRLVKTLKDLETAVREIGVPAVLKTAGFGYDGKGQAKIKSADEAESAFENLNREESVLEAFIDFEREVSVVGVRDAQGNLADYGVIENRHANHILDVSFAPASVSEKTQKEAVEITRDILETLAVVGVMTVEFFLTKNEKLIVNELAPRPHNSGHLTIDACVSNQFEQQLRAVCGLPLGATKFFRPAAMANLLGDLWETGEPAFAAALKNPNVKLHLYGKQEARRGRKMGHLTALAETVREAVEAVGKARESLIAGKHK
jgi:5-(carboxyamino)imidazole ribonucleotide synthase